jgi:cytochrome c553
MLACIASIAAAPATDLANLPAAAARPVDFVRDVQPIFAKSCYGCHGEQKQKSGLRLDVKGIALKGGEDGPVIVPGRGAQSLLVQLVAGLDPDRVMPPKGKRLSPEQIAVLRAWIDQGATWPDGVDKAAAADKADHWAYKPLTRPSVPRASDPKWGQWPRNAVDQFVLAKLLEKGLTPSPDADRRTLIRRVTFDLTGLPPLPKEVDAFVSDPDPNAYENLVDRLLASPRYGECWARHWLDCVHYGDTHGYDKDKPRPNAWPYRDYVIRAFNDDKPYARFIREQLAGDWFYPGTADGVEALGFIAAGPFDFVGQVELRDGTIDKAITRNLDRDDMVSVTMNTFVSSTAQCARCHDHKFDPIKQEDYYSLQADFAGVDRADRPYDPDPAVARKRHELTQLIASAKSRTEEIEKRAAATAGPELVALSARLESARRDAPVEERPEFGYHSAISAVQSAVKWVQVDLGRPTPIERIVLVGAHDTFNGIGDGFGFPVRYKLEAANDAGFTGEITTIVDQTAADVPNPGVRPQRFPAGGKSARFLRLTATRLAPRQGDYILAMGEMMVLTADGANVAEGRPVAALDSIEALPRWSRKNLVDGYYYGARKLDDAEITRLEAEHTALVAKSIDAAAARELKQAREAARQAAAQLAALPKPQMVYAACSEFPAEGSFTPTHGKPRPIYVLHRGSEKGPQQEVGPGSVAFLPDLPSRFVLPPDAGEAQRRAALADWIADARNPLTWRSIVNRAWQYHFGHGIIDTPNDFGRMGAAPTHPELLDWLAVEFRDRGQSLKQLNRLIVTSSTYRQSSANNPAYDKIDGGNQYLWRMNRRRLDAEEVHDAILVAGDKLDLQMGGAGYKTFGFENDHSPRYKYQEHDPDDPASLRRAVYRFVVRSVPDPLMEALDCADPSQAVPKRDETLTALQALALLNDKLIIRMATHFAERVEKMAPDVPGQIDAASRIALGRGPTDEEKTVLLEVATHLGLPSACRVLFNTNEFSFVD